MSMNLATITENASRLGMRLTESFSERTRDLAVARSTSSMYLDASDEKLKNLAKQLDSSSDREKLDAMKRLIAVSRSLSLRVQVQGHIYL
jgi:AP-3 complex subunit beta